MDYIVGGFYLIKEQYYIDFPDDYLKQNNEERRPFYLCIRECDTGIFWMIPLTSRQKKLDLAKRKIAEGKKDIFHLTTLDGKEGVMLLADMCPVIADYIAGTYDICGIPVVYKDNSELSEISAKARKVLALLRRGVRFMDTMPDIFKIEQMLLRMIK